MRSNLLRKILTLGCVAALGVASVVECGASGTGNSDNGSDSVNVSSANELEGASDVTETSDDMAEYFHSKDHYTIKIMMFGTSTTEGAEAVSKELSKITEEKLNADVELTIIGFGSFMEQLNMMLYSGDEFDLFSPLGSASAMATSGQIQPIGDLLEEFAPTICKDVPEEYFQLNTFNGEVYGVPVNTEKAQQLGFGMRKDICDELGIDYENMSTLEEIHDMLVKVKEKYPDIYPVVSTQGQMFQAAEYIGQDDAGDSYHLAVTKDPYAEHPEIVSFFETDLFKERVSMLYQWAQEGLIMPDASTNTEGYSELISAGKAFGFFSHMKPGWEIDQKGACGTEIVSVRYADPVAISGIPSFFVPTGSGDPERAVALLELLWTDPAASNLVVNGVEGEHYVVVDEENGVATYPDGINGENVSYGRCNWCWPNPQIAYLWEGQELDIWDQYNEFNEKAQVPTSLGFIFNPENVMNEITACSNVYSKYVNALYAGSLDPEQTLPVLNEEMEKAGINTIIEEKQAQLDAWLEDN